MTTQPIDADAGVQARLHSVEAVTKQLGIGRSKTFELIASGELRSVTVGKRRLIPDSAVAEFIEHLEQQSTPPTRAQKPAMPVPSGRAPVKTTK